MLHQRHKARRETRQQIVREDRASEAYCGDNAARLEEQERRTLRSKYLLSSP